MVRNAGFERFSDEPPKTTGFGEREELIGELAFRTMAY